jgi:hypothetical protein
MALLPRRVGHGERAALAIAFRHRIIGWLNASLEG